MEFSEYVFGIVAIDYLNIQRKHIQARSAFDGSSNSVTRAPSLHSWTMPLVVALLGAFGFRETVQS